MADIVEDIVSSVIIPRVWKINVIFENVANTRVNHLERLACIIVYITYALIVFETFYALQLICINTNHG